MDLVSYLMGKKSAGGGSGGGGTGGGSDDGWPVAFPVNDGNTHLWVDVAEGRTDVGLKLAGSWAAAIDWGDATEEETVNVTNNDGQLFAHQYATKGKYVISIRIVSGERPYFYGDSSFGALVCCGSGGTLLHKAYISMLHYAEIGEGILRLAGSTFCEAVSLKNVTLAASNGLYNGTFGTCVALTNVVFPNEMNASIPLSMFQNCYSLCDIVIPEGVTAIVGQAFQNCWSLRRVVFPSTLTRISHNYTFGNCYDLQELDFSAVSAVPTLSAAAKSNIFQNSLNGGKLQIKVPADLVDEWKAATNWSELADYIVGV